MKPRPNLELLRAKIALMSPCASHPVALAAARENFPSALLTPWLVVTASSSPPQHRDVAAEDDDAARSLGIDTGSSPTPAVVTTTPNIRARSARIAAQQRTNSLNFAGNRSLGINVALPVRPPGSLVRTAPLVVRDDGSNAGFLEEGWDDGSSSAGYSDRHSAKRAKVEEEEEESELSEYEEEDEDAGEISDEEDVEMSDEDGIEMTDASDEEARYVVVDAVGWIFREVATAVQAKRRCAQEMPPIDAGNGVWLYSEW